MIEELFILQKKNSEAVQHGSTISIPFWWKNPFISKCLNQKKDLFELKNEEKQRQFSKIYIRLEAHEGKMQVSCHVGKLKMLACCFPKMWRNIIWEQGKKIIHFQNKLAWHWILKTTMWRMRMYTWMMSRDKCKILYSSKIQSLCLTHVWLKVPVKLFKDFN